MKAVDSFVVDGMVGSDSRSLGILISKRNSRRAQRGKSLRQRLAQPREGGPTADLAGANRELAACVIQTHFDMVFDFRIQLTRCASVTPCPKLRPEDSTAKRENIFQGISLLQVSQFPQQ